MKKLNFIMLITILFQLFAPTNGGVTLNASETASSCFTYSLTADKTAVLEGYQVQFNFSYESVEPACAPEDILGEEIIIDFSSMVDSDTNITASLDSNIFDIVISPTGVVTLTFKDLSSEGETLVDFGGNATFTVTAKNVDDSENVTITDNAGDSINITINNEDETIVNTNKVSNPDYAEVGDTVEYTVMINGDNNHIENFHGVDSHSAGMEYIPGSFFVQEDQTWADMTSNFVPTIDASGNLVVDNVNPFDTRMLIYYSMEITGQQETYTNDFEANYDSVVENVSDDVWFDMDGGNWVDYTHGNIQIKKVDEAGVTLSGAEFDIIDSDGTVVDHVITGTDGTATSINLPLGDYTVVETKAPDGYSLDSTPHPVTIVSDEELVTIEVINVALQTPDTELPEVTHPDTELPEVTNPDIALPEVTNPDIELPEVTSPDITLPEVTNPDIELPEITNPDITLPEVTNPDIELPEITNPDITLPEVTSPDTELPEVTNPAIELPEVTSEESEVKAKQSEVNKKLQEDEIVSETTKENKVTFKNNKDEENNEKSLATTGSSLTISLALLLTSLMGLLIIRKTIK